VTAITNYLNELRNDDEPAEVKRKQSSTLPMWAVIIFGLIIVMGVLGIYLQPDPEPAAQNAIKARWECSFYVVSWSGRLFLYANGFWIAFNLLLDLSGLLQSWP
jgi:hypothetical protein